MDELAWEKGCPDEFEQLPGDGVDGTGVALVIVVALGIPLFFICWPIVLAFLVLGFCTRAVNSSYLAQQHLPVC